MAATAEHPDGVVVPAGADGEEQVRRGPGRADDIVAIDRNNGLILVLAGLVGALGGCSIMMIAVAPADIAVPLAGAGVVAAVIAVACLIWVLRQ
jgi:hypothetical protein